MPENATLNYLGNGWTCVRGYRQVGQECKRVVIPENATLNYLGNGWTCVRGYHQVGQECRKLVIPENATLDYTGNGWICSKGFKRSGNGCITMTAAELKQQQAIEQKLMQKAQRRMQRVARGGDCETEYKTNAEVCVEITKVDLDCNRSIVGNYYSDCDVLLSYEVNTNYAGRSYLDVEIECRVEIDYSGSGIISNSDSSRKDESHTLYAHDSDTERMTFNFSFSSLSEVSRVRISSARCEIESVDLR